MANKTMSQFTSFAQTDSFLFKKLTHYLYSTVTDLAKLRG